MTANSTGNPHMLRPPLEKSFLPARETPHIDRFAVIIEPQDAMLTLTNLRSVEGQAARLDVFAHIGDEFNALVK